MSGKYLEIEIRRYWEVVEDTGISGRYWEVVKVSGRYWEIVDVSGRYWEVVEGTER